MLGSLSRMDNQATRAAPATTRKLTNITPDLVISICTLGYLLVMLALVLWLLFDTWIGAHSVPAWFGYHAARLETPAFRLVAYTIIGGALGSLVNGIRSFLIHANEFSAHYVWKYITAPWMGSSLALIVYALIHSSIAVFGGDGITTVGSTQALANFAAGTLAGYGAKDVFIWLDTQVERRFAVEQVAGDVQGQPKNVAAAELHRKDQAVGAVVTVPTQTGVVPGTVVGQAPAPGEPIARGDEVNLVVASDPDDA